MRVNCLKCENTAAVTLTSYLKDMWLTREGV